MTGSSSLRLRLRWPPAGPGRECDSFFLGVWHPRMGVRVEPVGVPPVSPVVQEGRNWLLASASSPLHPAGTGLVHAAPGGSRAVAFRGYILPRLHSYSASDAIVRYWSGSPIGEHNGVFAAAVVDRHGATLTLVTDLCGVGPLYYRMLGEAVVFATNPRYLAMGEDRPDLVAWRCLLQTSWIGADRSLSEGVSRVPPGSVLRFSSEGFRRLAWFDLSRLPEGTRSVGPGAVAEVEEAFQESMRRCVGLQPGSLVLPLSSGFDSRRILASLVGRKLAFQALTCRVLQKEERDLDARFASAMARDVSFPHAVVEPRSLEQYVADDRVRRLLVDAETREHTWALRLMSALPGQPSLFFDGIGGDILGNPVGWQVWVGLAVEARPADVEIEDVVTRTITSVFDSVLPLRLWPSAADVRADLRAYLQRLLPRENLGEVAFILLRQRRAVALWSQQLVPPGHVVVCPYLDLDYLRLLLGFRSTDKHATGFQRACLREFWPRFYRYPGNRDIPADLPPGSPALAEERTAECQAAMWHEIMARDGMPMLRDLLTLKARLALELSGRSRAFALRASWYLNHVMELVSRQVGSRACWEVVGGS